MNPMRSPAAGFTLIEVMVSLFILAVIAGVIIGSIVNMALVNAGPMLIQPPEGVDITSFEGLKASMHLFQPKHFLFPWLAHAMGTLVGAFLAAKIAGKPTEPFWDHWGKLKHDYAERIGG